MVPSFLSALRLMPVIGAARIKLTDAEWQDQVVSWIDNSVVILAMASVSRWVEWGVEAGDRA
jgi:hypothetical protein